MKIRLLALTAFLLLAACASQPPKTGGPRTHPIDMIVIHSISGPICTVEGHVEYTLAPPFAGNDAQHYLAKMETGRRQVSIHYVIGRRGDVAAGAAENVIAYHARNPDVNGRSIGIELVNDGDGKDPFPPAQIDALVKLIKEIRARYSIPLAGIVRHADVDQRLCLCPQMGREKPSGGATEALTYRRRPDPGSAFPFDQVRAAVKLPGETIGQLQFVQLTGLGSKEACSESR